MSRCVVVGAGLGGLSAACHLAGAGHDVTVVERDDEPGGRAGSIELGGYRFDTGPTVLTMPELFERCFHAVGEEMSSYLTVRPLDPMYRACFSDGSELNVRPGREAMAAEIADVCGPAQAAGFHRFADWVYRAVPLRDAELHRAQLRLGARPHPPTRPGAAPAATAGVPAPGLRRSTTSSTMSACNACSAFSRCTPGWRRTERCRSTP